ncbi:helix-turn-helix domain-containing protein [Defluviimonas salinarum]|uniref:Helix-turn-helix domain-containing protein n=1 Tax=Defluviimonas salinarum TaxID=2992147 RepID=A0ABT3J792_9RHOB|nr:helix-turn-helix domain-containing protein [Defluviimonas salinarum]MCW3783556.1 helix-turn-helix domain-containing protein [Defluviimonas salinarum]
MQSRERLNSINNELAKKGYTQARVARELGVTPSSVTNVCKGTSKSRRIEDFISNIIGMSIGDMPVQSRERLNSINTELAKRGYTQARVARELGVTPPSVANVCKGTSKSRRIEDFISNIFRMPPGDAPMPSREHSNPINHELARRGYTHARVARELGVTRPSVSKVCRGTSKSRRIEDFIANIIGVPPGDIWSHRK